MLARAGALRAARGYLDFGLVALVLIAIQFLGHNGNPPGVWAVGIKDGSRIALEALGIVLVLRSNRLINFAQFQIGALSSFLFTELVAHSQLVNLIQIVCSGCLPGVNTDTVYNQAHPEKFKDALLAAHWDWLLQLNYWLALLICLVLPVLLSWLVYRVIIDRFRNAPRLIATVATLGVAQTLAWLISQLPGSVFQEQANIGAGTLYRPFPDATVLIYPTLFHIGDILTVAVAVLAVVAITLFLLFSTRGIALRAAAESPARAGTLGINAAGISSIAWMIAGGLAGLAGVVGTIANGNFGGRSIDFSLNVTTLVPILAAAVYARFRSLPLTLVASLALAVIDQGLFWNLNSRIAFQVVLLGLIAASLLLQRGRQSRAEEEASAGYLAAREARPIPKELRRVPLVDAWVRWLTVGGTVALAGLPFVLEPSQVSLAAVVLITAMVGMSLLVLTGWAGQVSLGQMAFAAVGAFVAAVLRFRGIDMFICLAAGGVAGSLVATVVGIPALRLRGLHLAVTTLALSLATSAVLLNPAYLGQYLPVTLDRPFYLGIDLNDDRWFYYLALAFLLLIVLAIFGLRRSRTGRALIALRDNENAGQTFGINVARARLEAFAISGFIAALAGGLLAFQQHGVQAPSYSPEQSVQVFLLVVIGGMGSVLGPILGAVYQALFTLLPIAFLSFVGTGTGLLVILLFLPGGLSDLLYRVRDGMLRRVAVRRRVDVPSLGVRIAAGEDGRVPIEPKTRPGGGPDYVPTRYRLGDQWAKLREASGG